MNLLVMLLKGFSSIGALIIAIGAQNAFVIRQGLQRQYLLLTALTCSLIDSLLILLGVNGFGHLISSFPSFIDLTQYFAAIFLFIYGALSFKSAFKNKPDLNRSTSQENISSAKRTLFSLLAFSLLNPHVYLDTVVLLGSIASQHPPGDQVYFAIGAIAASFTWFFSLTYGAHLLSPLFQKEYSWKIIDSVIALTMWVIAFSLLT